jgi:DNA-directed RNA polymerase beta' subunit
LLISPDRLPHILSIKNKEKRLNEISQNSSNRCGFDEDPGCSCKQPKFRQRKMDITIKTNDDMESEVDEDSNRVLPASEAYRILSEIREETIEILGLDKSYSRPKDFVLSQLIVSPPSARPSIQMSSTARAEDDLTHLYQSILSTNLELRKEKNAGQTKVRINELIFRL